MYNNIIKNFDIDLVKENNIYVVTLSGGSDSMCLLYNMILLSKEKNIKIFAMHVNHGIRGLEAKRDEDFVKDFCEKNNIDLKIASIDCTKYAKDNHKTLEEAARILRYIEFDKYIKTLNKKYKKDIYLVVAHHMKDQVETIIHNMVRGTGIKGLVGIEKENGYIIRPMLSVLKDDIDIYIKKNNILFVEDSTNNNEEYTRNYIRKTILSDLLKINDNVIGHIYNMSKDIKEADEYFVDLSKYIFDNILLLNDVKNRIVIIDNDKFSKERHITKIYIIRHIIDVLKIPKKDIKRVHMDDIINLSMKEKGGHLDLPYNMTVDKKKKKLFFCVHDKNISMSKRKKV